MLCSASGRGGVFYVILDYYIMQGHTAEGEWLSRLRGEVVVRVGGVCVPWCICDAAYIVYIQWPSLIFSTRRRFAHCKDVLHLCWTLQRRHSDTGEERFVAGDCCVTGDLRIDSLSLTPSLLCPLPRICLLHYISCCQCSVFKIGRCPTTGWGVTPFCLCAWVCYRLSFVFF